VDMSHVSISRSYAVLVGLEAYVKTRRRGKNFVKKLVHGRDKLLDPEEVKRREEEERDKSESARRERKHLEKVREEEGDEEHKANVTLLRKLQSTNRGVHGLDGGGEVDTAVAPPGQPGQGPENAIAPEGRRDP